MISGGFESWTGWAVSNVTDVMNTGYDNQYSVVSGSGAAGSSTYGVSFVVGESSMRNDLGLNGSVTFESIMVNNTLVAHHIIENGNMFSKKFGGETGDDPDYFILTIKGRTGGQLTADSINFYLADYRFADNSQDYIIDQWTKIDVSQFGSEEELVFSMSGSDTGQFGLNTPTYFCADNITLKVSSSVKNLGEEIDFSVFPNPTTDILTFDWEKDQGEIRIVDTQGRILKSRILNRGQNTIDVSFLKKDSYFLFLKTEEGYLSERFMKQ